MADPAEGPPLPSPPFVPVPGIPNLRDIGGLPIAGRPGKVIRRGLVYRSSEPSNVTDEGVSVLNSLGVTHVYDLRSAIEIQRTSQHEGWHPREWPGAERVFVPVFLDLDYSPEALALRFGDYASRSGEGFVKAYGTIMNAAAAEGHPYKPFATILGHLAAADPSPVLIHCTAGKDRTGVICALILSLCGVEDEAVAHEYSLTELGLRCRREELVAHVLRHEALRGDREAAERMVGARKENMLATLAMIQEKYGSVERYLVEHCRLSPSAVEQIRQNLIVDADEATPPLDWESHAKLVTYG